VRHSPTPTHLTLPLIAHNTLPSRPAGTLWGYRVYAPLLLLGHTRKNWHMPVTQVRAPAPAPAAAPPA
jgi:hypothetical protein